MHLLQREICSESIHLTDDNNCFGHSQLGGIPYASAIPLSTMTTGTVMHFPGICDGIQVQFRNSVLYLYHIRLQGAPGRLRRRMSKQSSEFRLCR